MRPFEAVKQTYGKEGEKKKKKRKPVAKCKYTHETSNPLFCLSD